MHELSIVFGPAMFYLGLMVVEAAATLGIARLAIRRELAQQKEQQH
jgi:hypothetical protein